jgi:DNA primase
MLSQGDALAYYQAVLPRIAESFDGIPLVWATYANTPVTPSTVGGPVFHGPLRDRVHNLPTVDVPLERAGVRAYLKLGRRTVDWLLEYHHAVEFHSWTPTKNSPTKLRYARILLENNNVRDAAIALKDMLINRGVQAIPLLDGNGGVALYIPFNDASHYDDVRRWLHVVANEAAASRP